MNIRTFKKLDAGVYQITVQTEDWSELDLQIMRKFGEPTINIGGEFAGLQSGGEFTLDDNLMKIMSESPFTQRFDSRDYADAEDRAASWKDTVIDTITQAVTDMRANGDTFSGEEVVTV